MELSEEELLLRRTIRELLWTMATQCCRHMKPPLANDPYGRCADCLKGIPGQGDGLITEPDGSFTFSQEKAFRVARERAEW